MQIQIKLFFRNRCEQAAMLSIIIRVCKQWFKTKISGHFIFLNGTVGASILSHQINLSMQYLLFTVPLKIIPMVH